MPRTTEYFSDNTASYGVTVGNHGTFAYRRSEPRSKKGSELVIDLGKRKRVTLNGRQIRTVQRLLQTV